MLSAAAKARISRATMVVDNNEGARSLLVSVLEHAHFEICGEAEDGRQAISKVAELRPDVVVLDVLMPEMNGIEAAPRIRKIAPSTKVVLISGCLPRRLGSEAVRLTGAHAYLEKYTAVKDLAPTIRAVLQDQ